MAIDSKNIDGINSRISLIKKGLNESWSGIAADAFNESFNEGIAAIDKLNTSLATFNQALEKLEIYKANKAKIAELEGYIAEENAHPSIKTTETYTENGITKNRTIYVVNQALINNWQAEINKLVNENIQLKNEIISLLSTIVPVNIKSKNNSDIAHRGYHPGNIFENSKDAFIEAGENGFWGCEVDVRFDSNGNLVCSHNTVKNGENPASFEEYLDICKEYGMTAIIDLKYEKGVGPADPNLSPAILKIIEEKGMMDSCVLQTNNYTDIPYIRENSENARIWYLTDVISDNNLKLIEENNVECVNILSSENNAYKIKKLNENGIDVCVWNVQSETSKERILNLGAKYVMSDNLLGITPYQEGEEDFNGIAV